MDYDDYDLSLPIESTMGITKGLASYGDAHFSLFLRKAFIKALGYSEDALSRSIIGIINTNSGFNPCHANTPQLIEAAKRGIHLAGGLAVEFPTISIHESFSSPTSMFLRNLMSMDTEEMIRAQPIDACIMIGGCDKTVPAQLMGGLSADKPIFPLITGPMLPGNNKGVRIGACTDCRSNWAAYRAGIIDVEEIASINEELAPTAGTCGVMGTASTMACLTAALGLIPLSGASAPAVSSARLRIAEETGKLAVHATSYTNQNRPSQRLSKASFLNAITVLQAIGGSTNAVVHMIAIINRHPDPEVRSINLDTVDQIGRTTPLLVDLKPSGEGYMTDFHAAGGMKALIYHLRPLLHLDAYTYRGSTLGDVFEFHDDNLPFFIPNAYSLSIIRPLSSPLYPSSSLVVLRGNLAPNGAIMKASASKDPRLLSHSGPAVVFDNTEDLARRIDSRNLNVTRDSVLVLKNIGPKGFPGMPEAGLIPIPRKLARQGVSDMLRISDGRMSGTAGGTVVLHVSPEAAEQNSVFGVVEDGDVVRVDVESRVLELVGVGTEEIEERTRKTREKRQAVETERLDQRKEAQRGYRRLYIENVNQAHEGADFGFLTATGR